MATLMAFKRDIAVGIIPNLYSGIMVFFATISVLNYQKKIFRFIK